MCCLRCQYLTFQSLTPTFCTMFSFVNYCSDMSQRQLLASVRELTVFVMFAAYASTYVVETD
jgi:hypothetical protein